MYNQDRDRIYVNGHVGRYTWHIDPENPDWDTCKSSAKCAHCDFECHEHEEYRENCAVVVEHVIENHKVAVCEHCDTMYNKRSLKRHQAGKQCKTASYTKSVRAQGFIRFTAYELRRVQRYFTNKYEALTQHADTVDVATMQTIIRAKEHAQAELNRILGTVELPTNYIRGGWGRSTRVEPETWVNKEMYAFLCLAGKSNEDNGIPYHRSDSDHFMEEAFPLLIRYAEHPEEREGIVCMLELARDMENGNAY